jgi:Alginate lyase
MRRWARRASPTRTAITTPGRWLPRWSTPGTGGAAYRAKAAAAIAAAIGTEAGGRTLALGRNLASYVLAADLIALARADAALDARFRAWLRQVTAEVLDGRTLISTHEERPNNWGTMAGASRIAVDLYLGDRTDLDRAATVFRGWLGDRTAYTGFAFGEPSWQADPGAPVGVNPPGAAKAGLDIGGALPDDMRRGCSFTLPPCHTGYAWEALQGALLQAELLSRHGYPAFGWGDDALLRAALFLDRLNRLYGGWWADGDDAWQPWVVNHAYGTSFPATTPARSGKILGWTDWVYGR